MDVLFGAAAGAIPCLMFGAFAVIVTVAIVFGILHARKRRQELQQLARKWGFDFYPKDPWDLPTWYCRLDLFNHGHSKKAENVMTGEVDGRTVVAFDYRYTTGSGKNSHTHHHQAVVFLLPIDATATIASGLEYRSQMPIWKGSYLAVVQLRSGGQCHLAISWTMGFIQVLGQPGHYVTQGKARRELDRILDEAMHTFASLDAKQRGM